MRSILVPNEEYETTFGQFFGRYNWHWFVNLTTPFSRTSEDFLQRKFLDWRRHIAIVEKICIGYVYVPRLYPHPHIHALLLGSRNNLEGKTLKDVSKDKWAQKWVEHIKGKKTFCKKNPSLLGNLIEDVRSNFRVSRYIGKNAHQNDFTFYVSKPRFLKKHRRSTELERSDPICMNYLETDSKVFRVFSISSIPEFVDSVCLP